MKRILLFLITATMATSGLYGVSIQHLRDKGAVPGIGRYQPRLNLSYKNIDYLDGLSEVRNIERARIMRLDNNDLTSIPEGSLAAVEDNLQVLNLSNNKLTAEGLQGLAGLKNLRALILNSNNVEEIPQEVLDGLPKLTFISLYDNPISVEKINQLRHQGYYVSTWPITRSNLRKAGLIAIGLTGLILSAIGAIKVAKSKFVKETFDTSYITADLPGDLKRPFKEALNLLSAETIRRALVRTPDAEQIVKIIDKNEAVMEQLRKKKDELLLIWTKKEEGEEKDALDIQLKALEDAVQYLKGKNKELEETYVYLPTPIEKFDITKYDIRCDDQKKKIQDFFNAGTVGKLSREEMRQQYRELSLELHPDKKGGSAGAFEALNAAWADIRSERVWN